MSPDTFRLDRVARTAPERNRGSTYQVQGKEAFPARTPIRARPSSEVLFKTPYFSGYARVRMAYT